jgi:hypothetical protein
MNYIVSVANQNEDSTLKGKIMSVDEAWNVLKDEVKMVQLNQEVMALSTTSSQSSEATDSGVPCKRQKGIWALAEEVAQSSESGNTNSCFDEVEEYMKINRIKPHEDPLKFWKIHSTKFPILSELAQSILAIPASSGSVERVFSIAGAIARARRSSLAVTTVREILTYREYVEQNDGSLNSPL